MKPVALVDWIDSSANEEPAGLDQEMVDYHDNLPMQSVGFLLRDDAEMVVLGLSAFRNRWSTVLFIPRVAVKRVRVLRKGG